MSWLQCPRRKTATRDKNQHGKSWSLHCSFVLFCHVKWCIFILSFYPLYFTNILNLIFNIFLFKTGKHNLKHFDIGVIISFRMFLDGIGKYICSIDDFHYFSYIKLKLFLQTELKRIQTINTYLINVHHGKANSTNVIDEFFSYFGECSTDIDS